MDEIKCPSCGKPYMYWGREKFIKCECQSCKHIFYSLDKKPVGKPIGIILSLSVYINGWLKTNWTKVRTIIGNTIISERTVYKSHCWNCYEPIIAVNKGTKFNKFLGNHIYGNKKCKKPDCNYFVCHKCGSCLCDSSMYKKNIKPVSRIWKD